MKNPSFYFLTACLAFATAAHAASDSMEVTLPDSQDMEVSVPATAEQEAVLAPPADLDFAPLPAQFTQSPPVATTTPELLGTVNESNPSQLLVPPAGANPTSEVVLSQPDEQRPAVVTEQAQAMPKSLADALAFVYEKHPQVLAEREKVKVADEAVSLAVSDFRPDIGAGYSRGRERIRSGTSNWQYGNADSKQLLVTQPLFSGFDGIAGLKSAKERVKAARADLIALEQQVLYNVIIAYTGLVEAQDVLLLNQNNVDVLGRQRDATQVRFDVGELTKTDVSQAEARLASAKADEQQAVGDLAIAKATFMRAVGYASPEEKLPMPPVPPTLPKTLEEASAQAREASPVLDAARHREQAFASDVNVRVGGILPDVNLQGSMQRSSGGRTTIGDFDNDAITLNVSIPLYQSGAEWSRLREARNIASQAKFNTLDTGLAVEQDVTSAWQNFVTAESVIVSTDAAAKAASTALEGVRQENEFGVRTVLDVLDAEQEYMNTKVNLVRAMRNHKIQAYRLLASVGRLTAKELMLPVKVYDPQDNYNDVKYQLLGL